MNGKGCERRDCKRKALPSMARGINNTRIGMEPEEKFAIFQFSAELRLTERNRATNCKWYQHIDLILIHVPCIFYYFVK